MIHFFTEEIEFKIPHPRKTSRWVKEIIKSEKAALRELNFIFCSDHYLQKLNLQYLKHKTFTDIVTFDNSDGSEQLEGDIFISIDRIKDNALKFGTSFDEELHRVIIHGVFHLIGYSDKTEESKALMRKKEDVALSLR